MPEGWCFHCHRGIGSADSHPQVRTVQVCSFCHQASQGHRNIAQKPPMANGGTPSLLVCQVCSKTIQGACVGNSDDAMVCWQCHKKGALANA